MDNYQAERLIERLNNRIGTYVQNETYDGSDFHLSFVVEKPLDARLKTLHVKLIYPLNEELNTALIIGTVLRQGASFVLMYAEKEGSGDFHLVQSVVGGMNGKRTLKRRQHTNEFDITDEGGLSVFELESVPSKWPNLIRFNELIDRVDQGLAPFDPFLPNSQTIGVKPVEFSEN